MRLQSNGDTEGRFLAPKVEYEPERPASQAEPADEIIRFPCLPLLPEAQARRRVLNVGTPLIVSGGP